MRHGEGTLHPTPLTRLRAKSGLELLMLTALTRNGHPLSNFSRRSEIKYPSDLRNGTRMVSVHEFGSHL